MPSLLWIWAYRNLTLGHPGLALEGRSKVLNRIARLSKLGPPTELAQAPPLPQPALTPKHVPQATYSIFEMPRSEYAYDGYMHRFVFWLLTGLVL